MGYMGGSLIAKGIKCKRGNDIGWKKYGSQTKTYKLLLVQSYYTGFWCAKNKVMHPTWIAIYAPYNHFVGSVLVFSAQSSVCPCTCR